MPSWTPRSAVALLAASLAMVAAGCSESPPPSRANLPPLIEPPTDLALEPGQVWTVDLRVSDPEGDAVSLSLQRAPQGVALSGTALTWTPAAADVGAHAILVKAVDSGSPPLAAYLLITVVVEGLAPEENHAPVVVPLAEATLSPGRAWSAQLSISDPDGDAVAAALEAAPAGLALEGATLSWTPTEADVGVHSVLVRVTDDGAPPLTTYLLVRLSVQGAAPRDNHAPVVVPVPEATLSPGEAWSAQLQIADPDEDEVTLTLDHAPQGLTLEGSTLSWTPSEADVGVHSVLVKAADDGAPPLTTYLAVRLFVRGPEPRVNHAPVAVPVPDAALQPGEAWAASVQVSDPDGDAVALTLESAPEGVTLTGTTLAWTPTAADVGTHAVLVRAVDDGAPPLATYLAARVKVEVPAAPDNHAPVAAPVPGLWAEVGEPLTQVFDASDPDGDALAWEALQVPAGATFDPATATLLWTPALADVGSHFVVLKVSDDGTPVLSEVVLVPVVVRDPWASPAGPGLWLEVLGAQIGAGGETTVTFRATDEAGAPVDLTSASEPVALRFLLARLDEEPGGFAGRYAPYTLVSRQSASTGESALQGEADAGGTLTAALPSEGRYTYRFGTLATGALAGLTHTVAVVGRREAGGVSAVAEALHHFRPDGAPVETLREVVQTAACDQCHRQVSAHDGLYRRAGLCGLCHAPQTADPDTGNSLDLPVLVHKVHRGRALPSVLAGTPYRLVGSGEEEHDYSTVAYPQDIRDCGSCHQGAQADLYRQRPRRTSCGSCHDDVSFVSPPPAGTVLHPGGAQADDSQCAVCHPEQGGLSGIADGHLNPATDPTAVELELAITVVDSTGPGQTPQVHFTVRKDGQPLDLLSSPLARLTLTVAGPTPDYSTYYQSTVQGSGATGSLAAVPGGFRYTPSVSIPAGATGTWAFGLEGYVQSSAASPRWAAYNPVFFAAVTDPAPVPRREVIDGASCDRCHGRLAAHGGVRANPQYCLFCHNPTNDNDDRVARFEGRTVFPESVDFKVMIHKIHRGADLSQPYVLGGNPSPTKANPAGTPVDFGTLRYPDDSGRCGGCHLPGTERLPLAAGGLPSRRQVLACVEDPAADGDSYCDQRTVLETRYTPPASAVCTSCHDRPETSSHALSLVAADGTESCATCHGPGAAVDPAGDHR